MKNYLIHTAFGVLAAITTYQVAIPLCCNFGTPFQTLSQSHEMGSGGTYFVPLPPEIADPNDNHILRDGVTLNITDIFIKSNNTDAAQPRGQLWFGPRQLTYGESTLRPRSFTVPLRIVGDGNTKLIVQYEGNGTSDELIVDIAGGWKQ